MSSRGRADSRARNKRLLTLDAEISSAFGYLCCWLEAEYIVKEKARPLPGSQPLECGDEREADLLPTRRRLVVLGVE